VKNYIVRYKGYIIDFTPFDAGNGTFGARWAIAKDDAVWSGSVPLSSSVLVDRGKCNEMAELGKQSATQLIDGDRTDADSTFRAIRRTNIVPCT
jgi:hypothetical protein